MIELLGVGVPAPGGAGDWLLHRVCARIDGGRLVTVVSSRAAERQALLDAVTAHHVPEEGRVWVQGVPVMRETRARVRALVSDVDPAGPVTAGRSLLWNALSGPAVSVAGLGGFLRLPRAAERRAALAALARVGLERLAHAPTSTLDAEARARLLLARALTRRPVALVVRELDDRLGARDAARVLDRLRDLVHGDGRTVLVGLADAAVAAGYADRIVVLSDGRLVFDGPPAREDAARWLSTAVHRDVHRPAGRGHPPDPTV